MTSTKALLLLIEALTCFAVPALLLLMGILSSPIWLMAALGGMPQMLIAIVCGCFGVFGIAVLFRKIVRPAAEAPSPLLVWACLLAGFTALSPLAIEALNPDYLSLTLGAPIVVTLHFVFLARRYLFSSHRK